MARALEAKVSFASSRAFGAFEVADAFTAAATALEHEDVDDERVMLGAEPLFAHRDGGEH